MTDKMLTVLVCGGRNYTDRVRLEKLLDFNRAKIALIVHGGARGADTLAGSWAALNEVPCLRVPAQWTKFGKKAGFIRNEKMLSLGKPDLVVAFPGGAGTAMMVRLARKSGIRVLDVAEIDRPKTLVDDGCVLELEDRGNTYQPPMTVDQGDQVSDVATQHALALHDAS